MMRLKDKQERGNDAIRICTIKQGLFHTGKGGEHVSISGNERQDV